jgi:hypothetical protein
MTDAASSNDPFELLRKLWGAAGIPVPGMAMPTLDPQEVEKRISELRALDGWLSANLNMVKLAIQGLEVQKAALLAMRGASESGKQGAGETAKPGEPPQAPNPLVWPWALMQQAMGARPTEPAGEAAPPAAGQGKDKK